MDDKKCSNHKHYKIKMKMIKHEAPTLTMFLSFLLLETMKFQFPLGCVWE